MGSPEDAVRNLGSAKRIQYAMRSDTAYRDLPARRLANLRNGLLRLHKVLLDSERGVYERDVQKIRSQWELLGLVMNDPWFAWLRELSGLVVQIDERLAGEEPTSSNEAERFIVQAKSLLVPSEEGRGFEKRYFEALQRDPDVILAHAEMMKVLAGV